MMERAGEKAQQQVIEERFYDKNNKMVIRRYIKGRFLGKGGFAKVYEMRNMERNDQQAVKVVPKSTLTKPRAKQKL